jgi:hypothetical protein
MTPPSRRSVDLSAYPDLVVIYLGYRASAPRGVLTLLQIGLGLIALRKNVPPGLLAHEFFLLGPFHVGFRQYWRDLESLRAFTRAPRHAAWWAKLGKDTKGGGFWHETYCKKGGMEAIYIDMPRIGFALFAPPLDPVGPHVSTARRLGRADVVDGDPPPSFREDAAKDTLVG